MWARRLFAGLLAGGVLLLTVPVWNQMRADHLAGRQPELALVVNPQHVGALTQVALEALERGDHPAAEAAALPLLGLRPLENQPYRILAAVYEATGRSAMAVAAHQAAIRMSPRAAPSRLWLATRDLQQGRYDAAVTHLDWSLRVQPTTHQVVFPVLIAGLSRDGFREPLLETLKRRPAWRNDFLGRLAQQQEDLEIALGVVLQLAAAGPLDAPEKQAWLQRLEREQHWDAYQQLDPGRLQRAESAPDALLTDGQFEREAAGMGSGWRVGRIPGATITLSGNSGRPGGGRALTIEFSRQRVPFDHVRQLLKLSPGEYRLAGEARLDDLRTARGLRWVVRCEQGGQQLGSSPLFVGQTDWAAWSFDFSVPEGCETQWLTLRLDARGPSESLISGLARFDALSIEVKAPDVGAAPQSVSP